ncbi:DUF302 domain-containing protein [Oceanibacterium hippocampi]|uniref:DUF302 domain-containing protein n=1 Tax=Oceanibacterium hippocampi TaxID=745714 RepID=A0A1Y5T6C7_9PROT|nr:DUF302 domain-containing protein [Oceanibacterium hippocampi]SLN56557.1 hypothetical protein OCH7691_02460 [Oceanibacterium hippocampi]
MTHAILRRPGIRRLLPLVLLLVLLMPPVAGAAPGDVLPGMESRATAYSFDALVSRLEAAIKNNKMGLVTRASASAGAASRGITIPGNMVVGVYRNDFAVRMLEASVAAGIEAPIRFYVTANTDGTATLSYQKPSEVFRPYGSAPLDELARELDAIFAAIMDDATRQE